MRRPLFRKQQKYIVVRPIYQRTGTKVVVIEPGAPCPSARLSTMRRWHKRNRIGPKGDPWTKMMIESWKERTAREAAAAEKLREEQAANKAVIDEAQRLKVEEALVARAHRVEIVLKEAEDTEEKLDVLEKTLEDAKKAKTKNIRQAKKDVEQARSDEKDRDIIESLEQACEQVERLEIQKVNRALANIEGCQDLLQGLKVQVEEGYKARALVKAKRAEAALKEAEEAEAQAKLLREEAAKAEADSSDLKDKFGSEELELLGSVLLPEKVKIGKKNHLLSDIIAAAQISSGYTPEQWNELSSEQLEVLINTEINDRRSKRK